MSQGLQQSMDKSINMTVRISESKCWKSVQHSQGGLSSRWRTAVSGSTMPSWHVSAVSILTQEDFNKNDWPPCSSTDAQSITHGGVLQSVLSSRHDQLMTGFNELELAHQAHAARAREAFEQLAQEAAALEHRQARYEALQVSSGSAIQRL
jgi:hypothetical protein